jgi:arylsulfatase A-like enzyme
MIKSLSSFIAGFACALCLQTALYAEKSPESKELGAVSASAAELGGKAIKQPNVIVILTDDQGYGDLACHGNPIIQTPHLDQLHSNGVRLTDFHVSPVCTPTRAALMTGLYPNRVGAWHVVMSRSLLNADETTMADVFSRAGYRTAIFGKWHLGDNYPYRPQDRGFDEVLVHGGGVVGHVPDYWLNDYFDDTYLHNGVWKKYPGYCTDVWANEATRFISENRDNPFFVYLSFNAPHSPFQVPEKYAAPYRSKLKGHNPAFFGMITRIDENVGRLMQELRRMQLDDNTIVLFMTDNGTVSGGFNAGMRGRKGSNFDGGHRVPCWFYWPAGGLLGGRDVTKIANHVDIMPTLVDLCGLNSARDIKFDGRSLSPLLRGTDENWPDRTLFVECQWRLKRPIKWKHCAVMTDRWRLINGRDLYDMESDPSQERNIAKQNPEAVNRLRLEYEKWWSSVSESHDKVTEIIVGSPHENPSRLTCYSWNNESGSQGKMPWGQAHVVAGMLVNGYWNLFVDRAGEYKISLRRWPRESGLAINENSDAKPPEWPGYLKKAKPLVATKARIRIQDMEKTLPIKEGTEEVTFTVDLKAGSSRLETWFLDDQGNSRGAFYVHIERL